MSTSKSKETRSLSWNYNNGKTEGKLERTETKAERKEKREKREREERERGWEKEERERRERIEKLTREILERENENERLEYERLARETPEPVNSMALVRIPTQPGVYDSAARDDGTTAERPRARDGHSRRRRRERPQETIGIGFTCDINFRK